MGIPETKRSIPKGFELGTTLSQPKRSILQGLHWHCLISNMLLKADLRYQTSFSGCFYLLVSGNDVGVTRQTWSVVFAAFQAIGKCF